MTRLLPATGCLLALLTMRCATLSNGPTQRVHVDSIPSGSTVRLSGCGPLSAESFVTPTTISVARRATQCSLRFSLPGYQERVVRLSRQLSRDVDGRPKITGNWCAGCGTAELALMSWAYVLLLAPSLAVDFATGSMYELSPPRSVVELRPAPPSSR